MSNMFESFFWMSFLVLGFVVICRMIMFKWMTPEQTEQHLRDAKERNGKILKGIGWGLKAVAENLAKKR